MPAREVPKKPLALAVERWVGKIKDGAVVDDAMYRQILDDCLDSVFLNLASSPGYLPSNIAELSFLIDDYDLVSDLLVEMRQRIMRLGYQTDFAKAANEYLFLSAEAFAVYPDIEDLKTVCSDASELFTEMAGKIDFLEAAEFKHNPKAYLNNYSQFFTLVRDRIDGIIAGNSPERLEFLSDYWSERSGKMFVAMIMEAAKAHAERVRRGKVGEMILNKVINLQLDTFVKTYTQPKE